MIRKNFHVFLWANAVIGCALREDVASAETLEATIELFRNGDVAITANGLLRNQNSGRVQSEVTLGDLFAP